MDWIRKQARLYQNLAMTNRYQAVVHLEDKEDQIFWEYQLQQVKPGRYRFIPYSKSDKGNDAKGCEQCLKYLPYLNNRFFICIDSDLRLLRGDKRMEVSNCIAQTYTYSWENHLCEAGHLSQRMTQQVPDADFDWQVFLSAFSRVVYRPLLYLVYYGADSSINQLWNVSKFNACIPLQPRRADLANNGELYLSTIQALFDEALSKLPEIPETVIVSLTEANAYLHVQGHQIYKLLTHIGTTLCNGKHIAFKTSVLDKGLHSSGYEEIDRLQTDLKNILS